MSRFSEFVKSMKEKDRQFFYGDKVEKISNKYFTFDNVIDEENIIVLTDNIKVFKDSYVLVVASNKVVYLKDWQVRSCHNYDLGINTYAVKLNKNYFKVYTFHDDVCYGAFAGMQEENFESLTAVAQAQSARNMKIADGWMGC